MERFLKGIHTVLIVLTFLISTVGIAFAEDTATTPGIEEVALNASSVNNTMNVVYTANNENIGWETVASNGQTAGNANSSLQAFSLSIPASIGNVQYRSLVDGDGWDSWKSSAEISGTNVAGKGIQAIQILLTDGAEDQYDIYYKVNVEDIGWLDWTKNGETAGVEGLDKDIREIQITYTTKDSEAPGSTECPELTAEELNTIAEVDYSAHVAFQGWQNSVSDGAVAGTTGLGLSIEAIKVDLPNISLLGDDSSIQYSLQCQEIGWTSNSYDGEEAGTTGLGLGAEAARIELTGRASTLYDVYYRAHSSFYGWFDWAKNGEVAGTTGIATPLEAIQIEVVPKDSPAPGTTGRSSVTPEYLQSRAHVNYNTHVANYGWQTGFANGMDAGTQNQGLQIEAFTVEMPYLTEGSSLTYQAHVDQYGWLDPVTQGNVAGNLGSGLGVQAFTIALNGEDAYSYDIYYSAYVENYGWLGWAKNGEWAGTTGGGLHMEAMKVVLLPRGSQAPGSSENAYINIEPAAAQGWYWPLDGIFNISSTFGGRSGGFHYGVDILAPEGTPIKAAKSGTVSVAGPYYGYGNCVVITNDETGEDVYYAHMVAVNTVKGAHVNQGDVIGFVGSTGNSTANHLHLGVNDHGTWIDPLDLY